MCHLIFFPYRPGFTLMWHVVSHMTAVQPSSHSQWYMCIDKQWYQLPEFIPAIWILASTAASASPSTVSMSPRQQNLSTNSNFALAPISTLVRPALVTGFKQPLQINDFITLDFTVYTTALLVYPFLTTSTLYWIATNTFTADPTWPSYSLLPHLLMFFTYYNLGFILTLMSQKIFVHHSC